MTDGMDATAQGPSSEDIESALNKTGFLLEHRVAKILRNYDPGPDVEIGAAYPDPESGKSREIDVLADFYESVVRKPDISVMVTVTLVIECKNNSGPFVLIGDRKDSSFLRDFMVMTYDPFALRFSRSKYHQFEFEADMLHLNGLPTHGDFVGRQLLRMNRQNGTWKADNNGVYDSILYPLAKAWKYHREYLEREKEDSPEEHWQYPGIRFILPVIVTSGPIYTVDATDDDLKINTVKWATIKRTFHSKDLDGELWADIVPFSGWKEYLDEKIMKIFTEAQGALTKNIHFYDPEWMTANFGEPAHQEFFQQWLNYHLAKRKDKKKA